MVTLLTTRVAQARSAGIDSTQFSNVNIGCLNCHGGGVAPMVNLSASATALMPGQQITLTFTVTTPNNDATNTTHPNGAAGFNMRTDTGHPGTFAPGPNTVGIRTTIGLGSQSEATHSTPMVGEPAVFTVLWTPNAGVSGTVTFTAWGNGVNFNGDTSGDLAAMTTLNVTICTPTTWYRDLDGDGFGNPSASTSSCTQPAGYVVDHTDCNDGAAAIHPGAAEICNGIDDNCAGGIDEGFPTSTFYFDGDGDSYGNPSVTKLACGLAQAGAGYVANNGDCNDASAAIHPGATEVCNGVDDNCAGGIDEGLPTSTFYFDGDGDGYGNPSVTKVACSVARAGAGYVANNGDCDDASAAIHPGATEVCNGVDDNCTGGIDEGLPTSTFYFDADGDGYGNPAMTKVACSLAVAGAGYVTNNTDCNDASAAIHPGATEICNGVDDNCAGGIDEGLASSTFYRDADGDGYGNPAMTKVACGLAVAGAGYVTNNTDCDDTNANISPGAPEVCGNLKDDNCNGIIDTDAPTNSTFYRDMDGDGFGATTNGTATGCAPPTGYVSNSTDCNDASAAIHPGATEVCNGVDDNCAGGIDEGLASSTLYHDADGDGYGNPAMSKVACSLAQAGAGYVANNGDCNDASAAIHPGATEVCNGVDDNCAGGIDEGLASSTFYRDADGDGYGNPAMSKVACSLAVAGAGYVTNSTDCDDTNANISPGAPEVCGNLKDDDCNGIIDTDAPTNSTFFRDMDGDGFGATTNGTATGCAPAAGYVSNSTDCNDNDAAIHPGATEVCNGKDDNCSGATDEGLAPISCGDGVCRNTVEACVGGVPQTCTQLCADGGADAAGGSSSTDGGSPPNPDSGSGSPPDSGTPVADASGGRNGGANENGVDPRRGGAHVSDLEGGCTCRIGASRGRIPVAGFARIGVALGLLVIALRRRKRA